MKTRFALGALAAAGLLAAGLTAAAPAAVAAPAGPQITWHYIIDNSGAGYGVDSAAANAQYHTATGEGGEFNAVIGDTWDGHQMYEWCNESNNFCLTFNDSTDDVTAQGGGDYPAAQAWFYDGDQLINQQATTDDGVNECLTADRGGGSQEPISVGPCSPATAGNQWTTPVA